MTTTTIPTEIRNLAADMADDHCHAVLADEESLTLAINYLDADQHERGWVYHDAAMQRRYIATERELIQLGRMIEARMPDAYSVWCSETTGEEFEETDEDETED